MCCVSRYKYTYGKRSDKQNPMFTEYFQILLCKSGPDPQLIDMCIYLMMSLVMYVFHMWQFYLHDIHI